MWWLEIGPQLCKSPESSELLIRRYSYSVFSPNVNSDSNNPDSKVHGANMGPSWGLSSPGGPYVGPMNLPIWEWQYWASYKFWWDIGVQGSFLLTWVNFNFSMY